MVEGGIHTKEKRFITVMDEDKLWYRINMEDIYYIETIKSTHYCEVVSKIGIGKLHADITSLHRQLSPNLFKVRASTLANLELVRKIDLQHRILYFEDEIFCTYTERVAKELKALLRIQGYRNYGGK